MDHLATIKEELNKQKAELAALNKSKRRWRSQAEIEREREREYLKRQRELEQQREEAKRRKFLAHSSSSYHQRTDNQCESKNPASDSPSKKPSSKKTPISTSLQADPQTPHHDGHATETSSANNITREPTTLSDTISAEKDEKSSQKPKGDPPLRKDDVIRKLRALKQPATFFGESDWDRFNRLRDVQISFEDQSDGQHNIYQKKMREVRAKDAAEDAYHYVGPTKSITISDENRADVKGDGKGADGMKRESAKGDGQTSGSARVGEEEEGDEVAITCKEDYVHVAIRKYMRLWNSELEGMSKEERRSKKGRSQLATYEQTKEWLNPLEKLLRKRKLSKSILDALQEIFQAASEREYMLAMRLYLERLAIGNAPWPMGATQVGIHSRAAREKIGEDKIAHVMNDEQTRKFIQAVKRLLTVAQRHFPTESSKMAST